MGAIADLWKSERGLVAVVVIMAATVMCGLGKISPASWTDFTTWIVGIYVAGKTVTSAVGTLAKTSAPPTATPVLDGLIQHFIATIAPKPNESAPATAPPSQPPPIPFVPPPSPSGPKAA